MKNPNPANKRDLKFFIKMCKSELKEWTEALKKAEEELAKMSEPQKECLRETTKT